MIETRSRKQRSFKKGDQDNLIAFLSTATQAANAQSSGPEPAAAG
ncbi:hypothetical protein [Caballeronia sp. LjRoot31]